MYVLHSGDADDSVATKWRFLDSLAKVGGQECIQYNAEKYELGIEYTMRRAHAERSLPLR